MENNITLENDINIDNLMKFLQAANGLKWGEKKNFVCPVCGGQAQSSRSSYNGHHRSSCNKCGMEIVV